MAFTYDFSKEQVEAAVESGGGTVKGTAKSLGCTWLTARTYIQRYKLESRLHEVAVNIGLLAEETIMGMILHAADNKDYAAKIQPTIIFTAKCKADWRETSTLLLGEDLRSPYDRLLDALDKQAQKQVTEQEDGDAGTIQTG